ncbi:MAG: hypothetical protein C4542_05220 [Dehalococcoidia bacterium]|nr:MAG: hypothetical protein C4542_05220 [Dehalococcoidia bacterium]
MLAVDIDNTIANTSKSMLHFGMRIDKYPANVPSGFWSGPKGLKVFMNALPMAGAVETLQLLTCGEPLLYITARPAESVFVTKRWLIMHGFPPGKIVFTEDKLDVSKMLGVEMIFEDDPAQAIKLAKHGIVVGLISQPYNKKVKHKRIIRFDGWKSVRRKIAPGNGVVR